MVCSTDVFSGVLDLPFTFSLSCWFTLLASLLRALFARVFAQLAHVVMSERASSQNIPLEPDVVIKSPVSEAIRVDDEDHVEFDLDELKEQLGIDSILEKLNVLAEKFSGERTEYLGSGALNSKSSSEAAEGHFDPTASVILPEVVSANEILEEEFKLPSVFEETESFGPNVTEVIAQRINDACSKKAMDTKLRSFMRNIRPLQIVSTCVCLK